LGADPLLFRARAIAELFDSGKIHKKTAESAIALHGTDCHCALCASARYSQRNACRIPCRRKPNLTQGGERHSLPTGVWAEILEDK